MVIKPFREAKNLTQDDLGKMLKVSRTTVSMWESGKAFPRMETLLALAKIFGCTIDELVADRVN